MGTWWGASSPQHPPGATGQGQGRPRSASKGGLFQGAGVLRLGSAPLGEERPGTESGVSVYVWPLCAPPQRLAGGGQPESLWWRVRAPGTAQTPAGRRPGSGGVRRAPAGPFKRGRCGRGAARAAAAGAEPAPSRSRRLETPPRAGDAERRGGRRAAGGGARRGAGGGARRGAGRGAEAAERGPAMGFLHQLQLLLWKNVTLKRRSPVSDPPRRGPAGAGGCAHRGRRRAPRAHVRRPGRARADPRRAGRRVVAPSTPALAPASGEGARLYPARRPRPLTFVELG